LARKEKNQGCGPVSASTGTRRQAMTAPKSNDLEQLKQPLNSKRQSYPKQSLKLISQLHIPIKKKMHHVALQIAQKTAVIIMKEC